MEKGLLRLFARQGDKPAVYPSPSEGLFEPKP